MDDAVAKALHAVRHHLAGGGFLSDLFSGPDYLSTGEVASFANMPTQDETNADFFKADRALRLAREVQAQADDVTGSVPLRAPLTAPRPGPVEVQELPVNIPFAAPERGVPVMGASVAPASFATQPIAYSPEAPAAPAAAAIGKLTARAPQGEEPSTTNAQILAAIRANESRNNPRAQNPTSSAGGLYQFLNSTWGNTLRRMDPERFGAYSDRQLRGLKTSADTVDLQHAAANYHLANDIAPRLSKAGVPLTPGSAYLSWFQGPGGAVRAYTAPDNATVAQVFPKTVSANANMRFNGKPYAQWTMSDLRQWADTAMAKRMGRAHGGLVDDALHVVREHHADGEAVGPVATDNSERVRAAESAANLAKQIQAYEASMAGIRQQPQDIQSMTHAPEKPRAPISVEALGKNREFGSAPYDVAGPLSTLAQGAYDLKTAPLYAFPPTAPLGMAIDTAEGVASGSPTQVAMGALGGPLKVARNVIAPLAVATGVTAPDEAEAAKLSKLLRVVSPEDRLMLVHNLKSHRLGDIEKLGGLPVPSTAVIKPSQGFTNFGDITMVAPKEMAQPSRTNPMFAADVYSPRFPETDEAGERIFKGFTPSGTRRYSPLTLENAVKEMKGNIRGGEGFDYGARTIRAGVAPQFKSIEEIQRARNLIRPREEMQGAFDLANEKLNALAEKYYPHYNYGGDQWTHMKDFSDMLREAGMGKWGELRKTYKPSLPPELYGETTDFLNYLKQLPTEYFEGKPQRAVRLDEFRGAVVPGDIAGEQADILRRMGVERLEQYDPNNPASRIEALQKFGGEQFADGGSVEDRALMLVSRQA